MYFNLHCADERFAQCYCSVNKGLILSIMSDKLTRNYPNHIAGYEQRVCSQTNPTEWVIFCGVYFFG